MIRGHRLTDGRVVLFKGGPIGNEEAVEVPCGQCVGCKMERSRQWAMRLMHEAETAEVSSFLTLTYSPEFLPNNMSVDKRVWQLFAKRLRKRLGPFRFYHCGEYGEENGRPHYHACVFGLDFKDDRKYFKTVGGFPLYVSDLLDEVWGLGYCVIGDVSFTSAAYVSGYVTKVITGEKAREHYERVDVSTGEVLRLHPEYSTMSRRPGLGKAWYMKWRREVYPRDEIIVNGQVVKPPKYYDNLFELTDEEGAARVKQRRRAQALLHEKDQTPERLATREKVILKKLKRVKRDPRR